MVEMTRTTRAIALALAILGTIAATALITGTHAVAQTSPGNGTSMTPAGNATTLTPSGNGTAPGPSITLNPNSGRVGTNVTITGTGFSTGQTFKFTFEKGYLLTGNMIQDTMGRFSTTALVPQNATNGNHEIAVASSKGQNATATFTVGPSSGNTTSSTGNSTSTAPSGNMTSSFPAPAGNETSPGAATTGNSTSITPSGNATTPLKPE